MALLAKTFEFTITVAGGTGAKSFAHGFGRTPKLATFRHNRQAGGANGGGPCVTMFGAATGATEEFCVMGIAADGVTPSASRNVLRGDCCIMMTLTSGASTEDFRADFTSFDATNININVSNAPAADTVIQCTVFDFTIDSFFKVAMLPYVANDSGVKNYDGLTAAQPKGAILVTQPNGASFEVTPIVDIETNIGAASDVGKEFSAQWVSDAVQAATNSKSQLKTNNCVNQASATTGATSFGASFSAWRPTGIALNVDDAQTANVNIGCIFFGGPNLRAFAGAGAQRTSNGTTQYTCTGVKPEIIFLFGTSAITQSVAADHLLGSFGVAVGASADQACCAFSDTDNVNPTEGANSSSLTKSIRTATGATGTTAAEANVSAVAQDSFTLNWTADATARLFGFLALEEVVPASGGELAGSLNIGMGIGV